MKFLEKIRNLPESKRKIILWVIVIILALILLFFWINGASKTLDNFQAGQFIKNLNLPKIEIPQMPELPDLNNLKTNATQ